MQACVSSRFYLTPVRDEEAESQRKARSRHARQTRRSTQGVTLTDLKEAQKTNILSLQEDRQTEDGSSLDEKSSLRNGLTEERRVKFSLTEPDEMSPKWSRMDEQGNIESGTETLRKPPKGSIPNWTTTGLYTCDESNDSFGAGEKWCMDENQNRVEDTDQLTFAAVHQQRLCYCDGEGLDHTSAEHDRLSRLDSGSDGATEKPLGRTSSYTRREMRLAALNRQEPDGTAKDYKKMYEEALHENEKLKSRLQDSKQELVNIRSQLEKVAQKHNRISERSTVLESEKKEKQALEKRVSDMEEELKVLTELKSDNQRLKDENGALIRVISKLSK